MGAVVALLNQKGGVGKTTVTLGLTSAAARAGRRVLVVDLDPQASATWVLGIDPAEVSRSAAALVDGSTVDASEIVVPASPRWGQHIDLVPSGPVLQRAEQGDTVHLRRALAAVQHRYDAVLVDCPPSLGSLTRSALGAARHALLVVEPSALSLRGIGAVADTVDEVWDSHNPDLELSGVVVNRVPPSSSEADRRLDELARIVGRRTIWQPLVPTRTIVNQAIAERRPVHSYGSRAGEVSAVFDALWVKVRRLAH